MNGRVHREATGRSVLFFRVFFRVHVASSSFRYPLSSLQNCILKRVVVFILISECREHRSTFSVTHWVSNIIRSPLKVLTKMLDAYVSVDL
jgi:hypothetical protein